ncbi:WD40 repeat-like protein [Scheffersomyces coipomensis]|uniref:WD40 repeat-like protein n=1 Tax=Scheffersomyces coipomensis TaxID=1788519 RepID=UPI00315D80C9
MNTHTPIPTPSKGSKILCINFNQDQGCFAVGHENGFLVYNTNPIDLRVKRNFNHHHNNNHNHSRSNSNNESNQPQPFSHHSSVSSSSSSGSGIGHITMLHRTNYLALVGGGKNPKFSNNKLIIWDDLKRKNSLSLEFMSPVLNVLLSRTRIIIVLKNQVLVYGFSAPPKKFATYETIDNELGLADLSVNSTIVSSSSTTSSNGDSSTINTNDNNSTMSLNASISSNGSNKDNNGSHISTTASSSSSNKYQTLAFPSRSIGQIQIVDVSPHGQEKNLVSIIKAHKSNIRCLALNRSGTLIASASETGTIIRVHSTHNTALLYEFRRGLDRAIITSIKFNHNDSKLAVLSDKNTLHIFNLSSSIHGSSLESSTSMNTSLSLSTSNSSANTIMSSPSPSQTILSKNNGQSQNQNQQHTTTSTTTTNIYSNFQNSSSNKNKTNSNDHQQTQSPQPQKFYHIPVNRHHVLQKLPLPLPNYFKSTWSFCSINTNQYHNEFNNDVNHNDIGVLGWSNNDNVIIIWKNKKIWERYVILEKYGPGNTTSLHANSIDEVTSSNSTAGGHTSWEIVRSSWKYLDSLED